MDQPPPKRAPRLYAAFLSVLALALIGGGGWLAALGGSAYYVAAGVALGGSAVLLWRGRREGVWLYAALLAATVGWSVSEAGWRGWALMPRVVAWLVVGAWMLPPGFRRRLQTDQKLSPLVQGAVTWGGFACAVALAMAAGGLAHELQPQPADPRYEAGVTPFPAGAAPVADDQGGEWREWGRDKAGTRFSPLAQITPGNVGGLKVAWIASIAISAGARAKGVEATPLMVGDTLFLCNGMNEIFAIDAETGRRKWQAQTAGDKGQVCRGVAYYRTPATAGPCAERILAATGIGSLVALDLRTGRPCRGFGRNGVVDLLAGLNRAPRGYYFVTSAPAVVRGKVVLGGWVTDGQYWGEPSGVIRAFDAVTGKLTWAWDMGRPDRTGEPAPGETYTPATPNSWAPISADEELGLVYLPMGNATPDYFGGQRRAFDDKYSSSVVALDAETGRPRWAFQATHHDVWDYDVASQPLLVDLPRPGGGVARALVQNTKRGEVFVLDRETGRPLREVIERPTPQRGAVPEERLSPTQPFSIAMPSFRMPDLRESDMWGITPLDQLWCRIRFRQARYDGPMTPPGLTPWITSPGTLGGMNWGSASIDRDHQVMIVTSGRIAHYSRLITRAEADARGLRPARADESVDHTGGPVPQSGLPYGADIGFFMSPLFTPCQAPPYGFISAVDLVKGKLIWTRPLGTARETGPLGMATRLPIPLGTPLVGGAITTRSGLIFVGATSDRTFRALDLRTGRELWESRLPHGGFATPMTYVSPRSGRQFVVIASSSLYGFGKPVGADLVAYALPRPPPTAD